MQMMLNWKSILQNGRLEQASERPPLWQWTLPYKVWIPKRGHGILYLDIWHKPLIEAQCFSGIFITQANRFLGYSGLQTVKFRRQTTSALHTESAYRAPTSWAKKSNYHTSVEAQHLQQLRLQIQASLTPPTPLKK
jgi:hypothetical protein